MLRAFAIAVLLAAASPASGENLSALRSEVTQAEDRQRALQARRAALQGELDEVVRKIEARKAVERRRGPLFHDLELDRLLRRSQALSDELTSLLGSELKEAEALASGRARLIAELDAQIAALRDRWASAGRAERGALVPRIKALRAERDALRGSLPTSPAPGVGVAASDDPEELRQHADALYDTEDKLRREEKAVAVRIDELRAERDLEQRMGEFLREGALFDEGDRRISTHPRPSSARGASGTSAPREQNAGGSPAGQAPSDPSNDSGGGKSSAGAASDSSATSERGGAAFDSSPQAGGTVAHQDPPPTIPPAPELSRGIVQAAPDRRAGAPSPFAEDDSLEALAARREQLRALADEARKRADEAARRARELR
jgi:hypothetical protein